MAGSNTDRGNLCGAEIRRQGRKGQDGKLQERLFRPLGGAPLRYRGPLQTSGQIISDKCHRAVDLYGRQTHQVNITAAGEGNRTAQGEKGDHLSWAEFALDR